MRAAFLIVLSALLAAIVPRLPAAEQTLHAPASPADGAAPPLPTADGPQQEVLQAFDRWANRQDLYSSSMVADMRQRLLKKLPTLEPSELALFRDDILEKLTTLSDPQLRDAQQWLAETLSMASDSYAKQMLAKLPDIVDDNQNELRAKLRGLIVRGINLKQARQGFDQGRQAIVQSLADEHRTQAQYNAQLRAGMTFSSPNLYSPTRMGPPAYARYSGYVNSRYARPSYGFGYGFGFGGLGFF